MEEEERKNFPEPIFLLEDIPLTKVHFIPEALKLKVFLFSSFFGGKQEEEKENDKMKSFFIGNNMQERKKVGPKPEPIKENRKRRTLNCRRSRQGFDRQRDVGVARV